MRQQGAAKTPAAKTPAAPAPATSAEPAAEPTTPDPSVDQPIVDPGVVVEAAPASWSSPTDPGAIAPQARVDPGALRREVFGFLPYWQVNSSTLRIQYDKISTIAYFGVGADAAGNLQKRNSNGTTTTGWSGWTSAKMTSIINDAHSTGTRVVLTVQSFAWNSTGKARQKALLSSWSARLNLARQIAAAVRDRGADGVNLDFEPLVAGCRGPVHRAGPHDPDRVEQGPQGLPDHVRHDRFHRQLPDRERHRPGWRRRHLHHGLRLPGLHEQPGREPGTAVAVGLRHPRHRGGVRRPRAGVEADPRRAVLRTCLVDRHGPGPCPKHQRREVRRLDDGGLYQRVAVLHPVRQALRHHRAGRLDGLPPRELHGDLRLRQPVAPALLSTTPGPLGPSTTSSTGTTCGARGSGRLATTGRGPSCGARSSPSSSPTRCRRRCRAARSPPRGSRRTETARSISTTIRMSATGHVRWGYRVQAVVGASLGPNLRSGTVANKTLVVHLERHGFLTRRRGGWGVSRDAVGRGRLREPVGAAVHGLRRQPRGHDRDESIARLPEPRWRRPVRFAAVGVDVERGGGRCRSCQGQGRARPARLVVHVPPVLERHLGWPRTRWARRQGRPLHVPGPGPRSCRQPDRHEPHDPRRSDDPLGALDGWFVRPARRPAQPGPRSTCVARRSCRSGSTVAPRSFGRSGPIARSGPESMPGTGMGDRRLARTLRRGRTRSSSGRRSWVGTTWSARTVVVQAH